MAARRAHTTPRARVDLGECSAYLARHGSLRAALRFLEQAEATFMVLAEHPGIGVERTFGRAEPPGLRSFRVKGVPHYLIFYFPRDFGIEVVRVLHGAQDLESIFEPEDRAE